MYRENERKGESDGGSAEGREGGWVESERDRYPIGVWRHLADDAYNGGNERNPV